MDLNLLIALDALLRDGSVAKAAERMGLSAPAMSRTLGRVRDAVQDPILVRAGRRLVPTPRALAMRERVRALVDEGTRLLGPPVPDRPSQFQRTFTVRADDAAAVIFGPRLLRQIKTESPGVTLRFVPEGDEDVAVLRDGTVDIDLGVQGPLGPEVRVQTLYEDEFVLIVRRGGPHARGKLTRARFLAGDHIGVSRGGRQRGPADDWLTRNHLTRHVRIVVPTYLAAVTLVAQTDDIAMVPRSIARSVERILDVKLRPLPTPMPSITIAQAWHPRFDADPAHTWIRKQIRAVTQDLRQPSSATVAG